MAFYSAKIRPVLRYRQASDLMLQSEIMTDCRKYIYIVVIYCNKISEY